MNIYEIFRKFDGDGQLDNKIFYACDTTKMLDAYIEWILLYNTYDFILFTDYIDNKLEIVR